MNVKRKKEGEADDHLEVNLKPGAKRRKDQTVPTNNSKCNFSLLTRS